MAAINMFTTGCRLLMVTVPGKLRQVNKGNLVFELLVRQKDCSARGPCRRSQVTAAQGGIDLDLQGFIQGGSPQLVNLAY